MRVQLLVLFYDFTFSRFAGPPNAISVATHTKALITKHEKKHHLVPMDLCNVRIVPEIRYISINYQTFLVFTRMTASCDNDARL